MNNKIIIFEKNLELVKQLCNSIFRNFNNLKLLAIASNQKELSFFIEDSKANLIILSEDSYSDECIRKLTDYFEYKIIVCKNPQNFKNSKYFLCVPESFTCEQFISVFRKFLSKIDEQTIHKKVRKILESLDFDFKLKGTTYLLDAIVFSSLNKDFYFFENLENKIYPYVAKKYKVSVSSVKWAIIRSINKFNLKSSKSNLLKLSEKTTSKSLISEIVTHL